MNSCWRILQKLVSSAVDTKRSPVFGCVISSESRDVRLSTDRDGRTRKEAAVSPGSVGSVGSVGSAGSAGSVGSVGSEAACEDTRLSSPGNYFTGKLTCSSNQASEVSYGAHSSEAN